MLLGPATPKIGPGLNLCGSLPFQLQIVMSSDPWMSAPIHLNGSRGVKYPRSLFNQSSCLFDVVSYYYFVEFPVFEISDTRALKSIVTPV